MSYPIDNVNLDPTLAYNYLQQATEEPIFSYGSDIPFDTSVANYGSYLPVDIMSAIVWNPLTMMFQLGINYAPYGGWYFSPNWYNFNNIYARYKDYGGYRGFRNYINGIYGDYIKTRPGLGSEWQKRFDNRHSSTISKRNRSTIHRGSSNMPTSPRSFTRK